MEAVPFVALSRQHEPLAHDLRAAFDRVVRASAFVLGEEVERFEAAYASYCGLDHCIGVSSGTAALRIALEAAGIRRGDEVVLPAMTFVATALAVLQAGARPVLCDVEPDTGLMDVDSAAALVGPRTAALLPVHLYGQMCDMEAVLRLARRAGLAVFEDAAQAHGATARGAAPGSASAGAAYSFYPTKNLGALGDGGAICTNDPLLAERARQLRNLGQRRKGEHVLAGHNDRLDGLQAALLLAKLPHLDGWIARRRAHARAYVEALPDECRPLQEREAATCTYHLFPVRVPERTRVARELAEHGIELGVHYTPAVHQQPFWDGEAMAPEGAPVAEAWAREELSLPMFPDLTSQEIDRVAFACHAALAPEGATR
jgi:dTDP-4-amino-4,6-dideoxygalactose transaminase